MAQKLFLSVGECMIELAPGTDQGHRLGYAGDTLNTAWYARTLLPDDWDVAYFTRLGRDPYSARLRDFLESNGIDTRLIGTDPTRIPGLYLIDVAKGERSFTYWRDNSAAKLLADDEAALTAALDQADVIYLSAITLAILAPDRRDFLIAAVGRAQRAGKLTVFDTNIRTRLWENLDSLRDVTMRASGVASIVLPSFEDEQQIFGDATPGDTLARYAAAGARTVVVKNGGGPIHARSGDTILPSRDYPRVTPIDTTGAGDSFNGGLLAALLTGADLATALARAHDLASRVVQAHGALMPMEALRSSKS